MDPRYLRRAGSELSGADESAFVVLWTLRIPRECGGRRGVYNGGDRPLR